jgi:hypothetical protein
MPGDHLGPAADHHLADIAADLDLVVRVGHRDRVVVAAVAHHRDRGGPRADLLAGVVGNLRQRHQRLEIPHQPLADRLGMAAQYRILAPEALLFQPGVQAPRSSRTAASAPDSSAGRNRSRPLHVLCRCPCPADRTDPRTGSATATPRMSWCACAFRRPGSSPPRWWCCRRGSITARRRRMQKPRHGRRRTPRSSRPDRS